MAWIIFLFGGGYAFFIGAAFVVVGLTGELKNFRWPRAAMWVTMLGIILVGASAAPVPIWAMIVLGVASLAWFSCHVISWQAWQARRRPIQIAMLTVWSLVAFCELPYLIAPTAHIPSSRQVHVIGDSITAGLGDKISTWPALLGNQRNLVVHDYSRAAATTRQALSQATKMRDAVGLVIVEIGGNDVLGSTSAADFANDLDQLLTQLKQDDREILMFELPLPPLCNEYGRVQRTLANKHGVTLIPKRLMMSVFTTEGATTDSVHLTAAGQEMMAAVVCGLLVDMK